MNRMSHTNKNMHSNIHTIHISYVYFVRMKYFNIIRKIELKYHHLKIL